MSISLQQLGDLIMNLSFSIKAHVEKDLKEYGLGVGQLQILMIFYSHKNVSFSQTELVSLLKTDKGNISRSVKKLVEKDYITLEKASKKRYILSDNGEKLKVIIIEKLLKLHVSMIGTLSLDDLEITYTTLSQFINNLEE